MHIYFPDSEVQAGVLYQCKTPTQEKDKEMIMTTTDPDPDGHQ